MKEFLEATFLAHTFELVQKDKKIGIIIDGWDSFLTYEVYDGPDAELYKEEIDKQLKEQLVPVILKYLASRPELPKFST